MKTCVTCKHCKGHFLGLVGDDLEKARIYCHQLLNVVTGTPIPAGHAREDSEDRKYFRAEDSEDTASPVAPCGSAGIYWMARE